jgi:phosphate transport system substrate-binding protein
LASTGARYGQVIAALLVATGCGTAGESPLRGHLKVACADGAVPLVQRQAEAFQALYPAATIEVQLADSRGALARLFNGEAGMAVLTRPVTEDEQLAAKTAGIDLRSFRIAIDGIAIVVHPANPVDSLTVDEVAGLLAGRIGSWRGVGGEERPVRPVLRGRDSGTYETVRQQVLQGGEFGPGQYCANSQEVLAQVAADPSAIGCVGMARVEGAVKAVRLAQASAGPYYHPRAAEVFANRYPLRRPVVACQMLTPRESPLVSGFISFLTSTKGQIIVERQGLVPDTVPERTVVLVDRQPEGE